MTAYQGKKGIYQLDRQLASGGEGAIFTVSGRRDIVAKIYHTDNGPLRPELERKLTYMAENPPASSVHGDIAWPEDVLYDPSGEFVGFTMPKMDTDSELGDIYKYNAGVVPRFSYQHRVIIAINICRVITAVHSAGFVFGDFNPRNIGINSKTGHVGFFDTDSYHITNRTTGETYRCTAGFNGYIAPELIKACKGSDYAHAALPTFTQQTDLFALAIHIFRLLMNGFTPFNGIKVTDNASTASPGQGNVAIMRGNYCFKPGQKPMSQATPDLTAFPETIRNLFSRAFIDGETDCNARPSADEWENALTEYYDSLVQCRDNSSHYYSSALSKCPYCEADRRQMAVSGGGNGKRQMSFSSPVSIPKPAPAQKQSARSFMRSLFAKIGALFENKTARIIIAASAFLSLVTLVAAPSCVSGCLQAERHFSVSILNKSGNVLKVRVKNSSIKDISGIEGIMMIKNKKGEVLLSSRVSLSGWVGKWNYNEWPLTMDEAGSELRNADLKDLVIYFKTTCVWFENGPRSYPFSNEQIIY